MVRGGVAAPLQRVARNEHRARHDAVRGALALGANVDEERAAGHGDARRLRVEAFEPAARLREQLVDRHGAGVEGAVTGDPVGAGEAPFVIRYGAGSKRRVFCQ